jgi:hypothetical protein
MFVLTLRISCKTLTIVSDRVRLIKLECNKSSGLKTFSRSTTGFRKKLRFNAKTYKIVSFRFKK